MECREVMTGVKKLKESNDDHPSCVYTGDTEKLSS